MARSGEVGAKWTGNALVLAAVALFLLPSVLAEPAGPVRVLNKDSSYQREVIAGEKAVAGWTVYNADNTSSFNVKSSIDGSYGTWELSIEPGTFTISPDMTQDVALKFTSKKSNLGETFNVNVRFEITEIVSGTTPLSYEVLKNVTFSVVTQKTVEKHGIELFGRNVGLPAYLDNNTGRFMMMVIIWLIVGSIARWVVIPVLHYIASKTKTKYDDIILDIIKVPTLVLIIMYGLVDSLSQLELNELTLAWIFRAFYIGLIIVLAYVAYRIFKGVLIVLMKDIAKKTDTELDDILVPIFDKIGTVVIVIVAAILLLSYFGVNVTVFVAGLGVAGLVVAFAAQDTLSNFFAGIFLLVDRPFAMGDTIIVENGDYCEVLHVGLRSTRLFDIFTQDLLVMPNNKLANANIINVSKPNALEKVTVEVPVAFDSDLSKVEKIMTEVAARHPNADKNKENAPVARLSSFGDNGVGYKLFFTVDHWNNRWRVAHEIRKGILTRFREEGVEIPYQQRVVRMKKE